MSNWDRMMAVWVRPEFIIGLSFITIMGFLVLLAILIRIGYITPCEPGARGCRPVPSAPP